MAVEVVTYGLLKLVVGGGFREPLAQSGVDVSAAAYRCELIPATGCESLLKPTAARLHTHPHPSSQTHFIPISCVLVGLNGNNGLLAYQS
ncbi:hypothetical protein DPX16_15536 [Anabarilius grahami]|uniref:Uncharacterized protein n=1 Tax=Anabarilius grahami TaxID=495550 RepID=A0A3N0YIL2_ANAGA|nr:hypothetical protein DPX16_15536 [Anabarilius grahami]